MYKHILITLDGSPRSEAVLPHATGVAQSLGAELTLLRIVDAVNTDWSERGALGKGTVDASPHSLFADHAQDYLDRIAAPIRGTGLTVRTLVKQGAPARQIVDAAKEVGADAIAMATHSRRGVTRLMFGSVAEEVLHLSSLPTLLVRAA
jgi:nucleotide-binding universal stress UspA family protein